MEKLTLLPAVDVQDGQAVQLVQGQAGSEKTFGDPLAAARRWQDGGASWLHLVDLDAAFGRGTNAEIITEIVRSVELQVEVSGGIRDDESLRRALASGAARVNIGTAALENPAWCERIIAEHGDKIAIGLDVRDGLLAARGWTTTAGPWPEVVERLVAAGCQRFVVTDVNADGMLTGPNVELLRQVAQLSGAKVIASGGIATLEHLRQLRELVPSGVEGAIVGTALYLGRFSIQEAIAVSEATSDV